MGVKLYAMTCGRLSGALANLMEGGEGEVTLPIPSYLIEHPKGTVLFDSGMHPDCQRDPAGRAGQRIGELFKFDYHPGDEVSAKLEAIGRDPAAKAAAAERRSSPTRRCRRRPTSRRAPSIRVRGWAAAGRFATSSTTK